MRLVDVDDQEEQGAEVVSIEKNPEATHRKKNRWIEESSLIYCKVIMDYEECNQVIEQYRIGTICIYMTDSLSIWDAQNMLNYLRGGIYALGGEVCAISKNIFMTQEIR